MTFWKIQAKKLDFVGIQTRKKLHFQWDAIKSKILGDSHWKPMFCFWSTSQIKTWFKQTCFWLIRTFNISGFKLLIADSNNFSEEISTLIGLESLCCEQSPIKDFFFLEHVLRKKYKSSPFPPPDSFSSKEQLHQTTNVV